MPEEVKILGWVVAAVLAAGWIWSALKLSELRRDHEGAQTRLAEADASSEKLQARLTENHAILRRRQRDAETQIQFANEEFARALLPVNDALTRALNNDHADPEATREGIAMVHRLLEQALTDAHLTAIRPTPGDPFDPQVHESIGMAPDSVPPSANSTLVIVQPGRAGWMLHARLIQAAEVMVRREPLPEPAPNTEQPFEAVEEPAEVAEETNNYT